MSGYAAAALIIQSVSLIILALDNKRLRRNYLRALERSAELTETLAERDGISLGAQSDTPTGRG